MEIWNNFKKQTKKRDVILSIVISITILSASYILCNTSVPLPNELKVLQTYDKLKSVLGYSKDSIPDEALLVNVSYDKQLVNYYENGLDIPLGQYVITDRQKLLDFLHIAQKANNYRYILLDVIFEKGITSPQDSALFHLIASMDRIVIAAHKDMSIQDTILASKAAYADYTVTMQETNFARFKYLRDGKPTIPLRMYQELDGKTINKNGLIYTSDNWICQNGVTLQLPIKLSGDTDIKRGVVQLGADLLACDSIVPIAKQINNKIVVIGDFHYDIHDTYAGPMSGPLICLNAYYALNRGDHIVMGKWAQRLIFYIIVAFVYFLTALCIFNGFSPSSLVSNPWLKEVISFVSIGALYWMIAVIGYLGFDTVYNFWIPVILFPLLGIVKKIIRFVKQKKK